MLFLNTTLDGLQMGLCFAVLALGVYISYSILDFPDLSLPSCFPSQRAPLPGQSRDCSTLS